MIDNILIKQTVEEKIEVIYHFFSDTRHINFRRIKNIIVSNISLRQNTSLIECFISVVMNAQLVSSSTKAGIIKFDDVKFSAGINDLSAYKSTGKFTCETGGIYLISASIMSNTNVADYYIYLNGNQISKTYIGYTSSPPSLMYHTGTVVLARQLRPNDSVWVYSDSDYYMYNGLLSTLTIVKVK